MKCIRVFGVLMVLSALAAPLAEASTTYIVPVNGSMTVSTGSGAFANATTNWNELSLLAAPATSGFNFSSATGSTSGPSAGGYYYSDYLFDVTPSTADAVAITLNDSSGVANLQARLYQYSSSGFAFDNPVASGLIQAWGTTINAGFTTYAVASADLTAGGLYVLEVRGTDAGNFGGDLSITPVPLSDSLPLMLCGLVVFAGLLARRNRAPRHAF